MADSFTRSETALELISNTMGELGLEVPTFVVGNTEKTVAQFLRIANRVGRTLAMDEYKWQALDREHTITTAIGQAEYDLPADFDGYCSDASWNRTTRLPALGSLTDREWQMLKARLAAGTTFTMLFKIEQNQIVFYEAPIAVQTIVLAYTSRGWVESAAADRQDEILDDTDVILFDPVLFGVALRRAWKEEKGFDTSKVQAEYDRVYAASIAKDKPGRTLSLAGTQGYPYLGAINVPDTGYGS